jgi:uncharacterized protein (TIGR00375 family)
MEYIADLHVHSPWSRATSRECTLAGLSAWARLKGIVVVGTGDFTHPDWFRTLQEELAPAEPGLYRLRNERHLVSPVPGVTLPPTPVRFLLSAEVSCVYRRHGTVRRIHNLLFVPDFAAAGRLAHKLARIGNLRADGRPILRLDSRDLLEMLLETAPEGFLVPAHVWTPWYSLFGSRSGFDSVEECFGDLAPHVFALETGLSSDPDMNRLVSALDRFTLISNSDCHSPRHLGREANLFATSLDFFALREAIRANRCDTFPGTVEFFPEEGKYFGDGHRACRCCQDPGDSPTPEPLCPVCNKPLTPGVRRRVLELADRNHPLFGEDRPAFFNLVPLPELLGELLGVGPESKGVRRQYAAAIAHFGSEFNILLHLPVADIVREAPLLGEAVARVRSGRVLRSMGYDGVYGSIRVFDPGELERPGTSGELFRSRDSALKR